MELKSIKRYECLWLFLWYSMHCLNIACQYTIKCRDVFNLWQCSLTGKGWCYYCQGHGFDAGNACAYKMHSLFTWIKLSAKFIKYLGYMVSLSVTFCWQTIMKYVWLTLSLWSTNTTSPSCGHKVIRLQLSCGVSKLIAI